MIFQLNTIARHGGMKKADRLWSGTGAVKYILTANDRSRYLLKVFPDDVGRNVRFMLEQNEKLVRAGIRVPPLLEAGLLEKSHAPFELYQWIPGISLDKLLETVAGRFSTAPSQYLALQYEKGFESGKLLREIHLTGNVGTSGKRPLPLEERIQSAVGVYDRLKKENRPTYMGDVFKAYLLQMAECTITELSHDQKEGSILGYGSEGSLEPGYCLLHGDFHTGNIIRDTAGNLWAADWIYGLYGDPAEDFVRIFVSAERQPSFARGQVDGYFGKKPAPIFWQKLKLFSALHQLEVLPFSLGRLPDGQTIQEHQQYLVLEQYAGMKLSIPRFYQSSMHQS